MNSMKKKNLFLILVSAVLLLTVSAHQPRIISENITQIENPEVSQAFYGNLKGNPDYCQIKTDKKIKLYVGILVPDLKSTSKDASVEVYLEHADEEKDNHTDEPIIILNGTDYNWTYYYEEYGGDSYYKGPEETMYVEKGTYNIKVYKPENYGKYVLVVGEKEEFPFNEMINAIITMPKLKQDFFEKSPLTAYFNLIGVFMLISIIIILATAFVAYKIVKKILIKKT